MLPLKIINFGRNVKGRFDLFRLLYRWDRDYKKEFVITLLAFTLVFYSIFDLDSMWDYLALGIEGWIIALQFGSELSIMPSQYRPKHGGVNYSTEVTPYISYKAVSYLMSYVLPMKEEEALGFNNPIIGMKRCKDSPLTSDMVSDKVMLRDKITYQIDQSPRCFIRSRHQIRYIAIRVANKVTHTTNGQTVSFVDPASALLENKPVRIRKSFYFDALLTLEAFRSRIFRQNISGQREVYTDLSTYFPVKMDYVDGKEAVRFRDDFIERTSGHIGITGLLLTENNKIALMFQGTNRAIDANTVTFGGSGSLSFEDIKDSGKPADFKEVVRFGIAREMAEETGMPKEVKHLEGNTMITGFFRWINRSGKPEFVGLTRAKGLPIAKNHAIDGDEVVGFEELPVEIKTPKDFVKAYKHICDEGYQLSLSSLMALHRLTVIAGYTGKKATEEQKEIYTKVAEFIKGNKA